jgi:branched-chain amino acid aminotransferase
MPITPTSKIWMDGELVDWDKATIHVLSHGLHYGTGAFEGIRAYETSSGPAIFRLREHMQRLLNSCKIIVIDVPFSLDELVDAAVTVVRENSLPTGCYLRPIVFLGYGEMGVNPLPAPVNVAIAAWPWGAYLGEEAATKGARMMISSWRRHDPNAMPTAAKSTGMYLNSGLAKIEAIRAGYDEAIMLGPEGQISEGTGENLFVVRNGVLITPPTSEAGALPGVTQDSVVRIARDLGYEVRFEAMVRTDLYLADEAFLTGTAVEIVPISSIDDRNVGDGKPGPVTNQIRSTFNAAVRGELPAYEEWLTRVK